MTDNKKIPFDLIPDRHEFCDEKRLQRQELLAARALPPFRDHTRSASFYRPSEELLLVINMALHTGSPLLLTGEPGTGKTQAADFIGRYFDINVYKFLVKSTSIAKDLIYEFDAVGYLHWAQSARHPKITSQPISPNQDDNLLAAETEAIRERFLTPQALWLAYNDMRDSVVLIDEIDKAPRDFPNDLLHEFDQHHFPHPFDPTQIIRPRCDRPPIIVITSNDERRLPDAFLRRCIFHRIELTQEIVAAAVNSMAGRDGQGFPNLSADVLAAAQKRFWELRRLQPPLEKRPSTAELLTWLSILSAKRVSAQAFAECRLGDLEGLSALIKDAADIDRLRGLQG